MEIILIRPALRKSEKKLVPHLAFSILAGMTPEDFTISVYDEEIHNLPEAATAAEAGIVGISVDTFHAARAYELADAFLALNATVILGGYHVTLCPEEALEHASTIVVGEAEKVWGKVLADFRNGSMKRIYAAAEPCSMEGLNYRRDIFDPAEYVMPLAAEFSRGCVYSCEFCSVSVFNHGKHKTRPVNEVLDEIDGYFARYPAVRQLPIFFIDDNIYANKKKAKELFSRLSGKGIHWFGQISLDIVNDDEAFDLLVRSGAMNLCVGIETINRDNLEQMGKSRLNADRTFISRAVHKIQNAGIAITPSFIIGYDNDTRESIEETVEFARRNGLVNPSFHILAPLPGTKLYNRYKKEGRLPNPSYWLSGKMSLDRAYFRPTKMTTEELEAVFRYANPALGS